MAIDLRRAAVELDLPHDEPPHVQHRIPRRSLDLESPRMPRVQLDLAKADASKATHLHSLPTHYGGGSGCGIMRDPDQGLPVRAAPQHRRAETSSDTNG